MVMREQALALKGEVLVEGIRWLLIVRKEKKLRYRH